MQQSEDVNHILLNSPVSIDIWNLVLQGLHIAGDWQQLTLVASFKHSFEHLQESGAFGDVRTTDFLA